MNWQSITDVQSTVSGPPYFNGIVAHADKHARYDIQVFLNCDILLTPSIVQALRSVRSLPRFLVIGQRLDLSEGATINPLESVLDQLCEVAGRRLLTLHSITGIDYFMFRRGTWLMLPPLIIGRGAYDNALVAHCLRRGIPVIDGTRSIVAIHQFHRYDHVPGGKKTVFSGSEERQNRRLHDIRHSAPNIGDAEYYLAEGAIRPNRGQPLLRKWETCVRFNKGRKRFGFCLCLLRRALEALGCTRSPRTDLHQLLTNYQALEPARVGLP
jgi:hypothetical protein